MPAGPPLHCQQRKLLPSAVRELTDGNPDVVVLDSAAQTVIPRKWLTARGFSGGITRKINLIIACSEALTSIFHYN